MDQISLFDGQPLTAFCVWAHSTLTVQAGPLTEADLALVPDGVYAADLDGHRMVLRPVTKVPPGQEYCHWLAGGRLFHGIFVGEAEK